MYLLAAIGAPNFGPKGGLHISLSAYSGCHLVKISRMKKGTWHEPVSHNTQVRHRTVGQTVARDFHKARSDQFDNVWIVIADKRGHPVSYYKH
jgi:hypothetical protein